MESSLIHQDPEMIIEYIKKKIGEVSQTRNYDEMKCIY